MTISTILARFQDEPSLMGENTRAWFESCIDGADRTLGVISAATDAPRMVDDFWFEDDDWRSAYRPYKVRSGVLQIPIKGVLLNGFPWSLGGYATGYEYINEAMRRGMRDDNVKGIALVIDSPGGAVAGNFDLSDRMFAMRGIKPIKAFAAESAYSAAYSLASAADEIVVTRSGGVGSVGVLTMHFDMSAMMADRGVKITYIFAGKHKVDGNPYEALPEGVRAKMQDRIDAIYSEFVGTVARNRNMDEKAVRKTEAGVFSASESLAVGFADRIGALDDELSAFAAIFQKQGETDMADKTEAKTFTEADLSNAISTALAEGVKQGAAAAMARINAIITSDVGKARPKAALNTALKTTMSPEDFNTVFAELPEEKAEVAVTTGAGAPKGLLTAAMGDGKETKLDADADGGDDTDRAASILARVKQFSVAGFKAKE